MVIDSNPFSMYTGYMHNRELSGLSPKDSDPGNGPEAKDRETSGILLFLF